jgi:hypothetical protein
LASDINALEAGKATVSGDTVTLTGGVRLENIALTVPSGVTLDLTKETLQLGNGATLTVNGTVNVKAEGINIDSAAASPATINGSGTIYLKSKGRLLGIWEGRKLTLDGVTLVGLPDNDKPVVEMGDGGEFVLKSGAITGNTRTGSDIVSGGGVAVWQGTFTMEGGTISGNTAKGSRGANGGGVQIGENSVFTMSGGTISGNVADGGEFANAGGVMASGNATFTMSGGTVSDNSAKRGGGVAVAGSAFTMSGGTISDNTATEDGGGGVSLFNADGKGGGTFIMEGGVIAGNRAGNGGGGVDVKESAFTLKGGRIQGGTDSDGFSANTGGESWWAQALAVWRSTAKWGTGGAYTMVGYIDSDGDTIGDLSGAAKTGGSDIVEINKDGYGSTMETLIATR